MERARIEFADGASRQRDIDNILTYKNISVILDWLEQKKSYNKLLLFVLCAYYGFDRNSIIDCCSSSWDIVDFEKHSFRFNGKNYPLVSKMEYALLKMKQSYAQDKIKAKWIYIIKSKGNYALASINVVNGFFNDGIQKLRIGDTDWSAFNSQTVRASLINKMYDSGCSLEEISYLTGAPISGMLQPDIISDDMIKKAGEKSWKNGTKSGQSKHPFNDLFNA